MRQSLLNVLSINRVLCLEYVYNPCNADIGKKAKRYIENGSLVPDAIMVDLICSELQKLKGESWLLDGEQKFIVIHGIIFYETGISIFKKKNKADMILSELSLRSRSL